MPANTLDVHGKVAVIRYLAEGLTNAQIIERLALEGKSVSPTTLQWYRRSHRKHIFDAAREVASLTLVTGLSQRGRRVDELKKVAARLQKDLESEKLTTFDRLSLSREMRAILAQIRSEVAFIEDSVPDPMLEPIQVSISHDISSLDTEQLRQLASNAGEDS